MSKQKYLTVQEFAERTGLTAAAIYLAIKERRLGCVSGFGERKAIPAQELESITRRNGKKTKILRSDRFA